MQQIHAQSGETGPTETIAAIVNQQVAGTVQAIRQQIAMTQTSDAAYYHSVIVSTPLPPAPAPTVNTASFDFGTAKLYKSDGDILEIKVPAGWQTTANPPSNGTISFAFTYGGSGPQDAPLLLQIQISDEKLLYATIDQNGKANSPATALQALIDANSTPQPGSATITFSKVQAAPIGTLKGQSITASLPASSQNPEEHYDIRLAQLPPDMAVYILARGDASIWSKGQPIIDKMIDSLVIRTKNIPTPTSTATLNPLFITATALQVQIGKLTPTDTPTP